MWGRESKKAGLLWGMRKYSGEGWWICLLFWLWWVSWVKLIHQNLSNCKCVVYFVSFIIYQLNPNKTAFRNSIIIFLYWHRWNWFSWWNVKWRNLSGALHFYTSRCLTAIINPNNPSHLYHDSWNAFKRKQSQYTNLDKVYSI